MRRVISLTFLLSVAAFCQSPADRVPTNPEIQASALPGGCAEGDRVYNVTTHQAYRCTAPNTWTAYGSGSSGITQLTGDATAGPGTGSQPIVLSPSGVTAGTFGDSTHVPQITVDSKGRATVVSNVSITGGASTASQLTDFLVTRGSSTSLTIGASCSPSTPCIAGIGNVAYQFVSSFTCTISAGSATAYIYVSSAGALTCGSNGDTLAGTATIATGISAFPADSVPLFTWTASNVAGQWDTTGGTDQRAVYSNAPLASGTGVIVTYSGGKATPSLDPSYALIQGGSNSAQAMSPWQCASASASGTTYTCAPNPPPAATYANMQGLWWTPDVACSGGATTINVNSLGAIAILRADGTNPAANDCRAHTPTWLAYNASLASGAGAFVLETLGNVGGGSPFSYTAVGFSATPVFTFKAGENTFKITLTGNVTSSTVASNAAGQLGTWVVCQDSTGSRTYAWPANFFGAMTIGSTASKCNTQSFTNDGTNFYATSTGVINQ